MIVDRLEDWARAGMPTTPERLEWARAYVREEAEAAMLGNYAPSVDREERPDITLSSHFYCPRQLWLKRDGKADEDVAPRTYNTWFTGRVVEASVVCRMILAGLPMLTPAWGGTRQRRTALDLGGGALRGSIDLLLAADLMGYPPASREELAAYKGPVILGDVKSMSDYGFDEAVRDRSVGNTFGYEDQLNNYRLGLEAEGLRVDAAVFVIHKKSTGHEAEILCPERTDQVTAMRVAYGKATGAQLPDRPEWATVKVVKSPKDGTVEQIENVRCGYCPCRAACWPGFEQSIVSGRPVYRRPLEAK